MRILIPIIVALPALSSCSEDSSTIGNGDEDTQVVIGSGGGTGYSGSSGGSDGFSEIGADRDSEAPLGLPNLPAKNSNVETFQIDVSGSQFLQYRYAVVYGDTTCADAELSSWTTNDEPLTTDDTEPDGGRTLCVIGRDVYGHDTYVEYYWEKDTSAPTVTLIEADSTNTTSMTVTVEAEATHYRYDHLVGTVSCSDANYSDWLDISSNTVTVNFNSAGEQLLCVQAQDSAGNTSSATTILRPYARLSNAPATRSNDPSLDITVIGTHVDEYRYDLLAGALSCTSASYSGWLSAAQKITDATGADGDKTLCVQARKSTGAIQPFVTNYGWVNDSSPPDPPTLTGTPSNPSNAPSFDVTVSGSDVYSYQFDVLTGAVDCSSANYGNWISVSTKITASTGADGSKRLCVRSRDQAENIQTTATEYAWTLDATPPTATLSGTPSDPSKDASLNVTVSSPDGDATQYKYALLDNASSCSGATYSVWISVSTTITNATGSDAVKLLCVIARDALTNEQTTTTAHLWTLDTTAPTVALSGTPNSRDNATSLDVSITDTDTYQYKYALTTDPDCVAVTYSAYIAKSTKITGSIGADNTYRLCVIGRDEALNEQSSPTEYSWIKDTTAPGSGAISLSGTPSDPSKTTILAVPISGADITHYRYKVGPTSSTDCSSSSGYSSSDSDESTDITASISGISDGSVTLCVYGRDEAGNYQDLADGISYTWTKDTIAPVTADIILTGVPTDPSQDIGLSVTVSGGTSTHYRHKVGESASTDCSSSTGYGSETAVGGGVLDNISGRSDTTLILCVITRDAAGNWMSYANAKTYSWFKDAHDPVPGSSGAITISDVDLTTLTLSWSKATDVDNATAQADLRYKIYRSTTNNIDTLANMDTCESGATCSIIKPFTADQSTLSVTGLSSNTVYYFNVRVRDDIGREAVYVMNNQRTLPGVHMVYHDTTNGQLKYARNATTSSTFNTETAYTTAVDHLSIDTDSNNKAHIIYRTGTNINYLNNTTGSWATLLLDSGYAQSDVDIALDSLDGLHVSFYRFDSNKDWKHQYNDGSGWLGTANKIWNGNGSAIKGHYGSIAIDSNDFVHVVGHDSTNEDLIYNTNAGGSWSNTNMTILDNGGGVNLVGQYTSIARGTSNNLYVSYYDATNFDLKFTKNTGGTWDASPITLDSAGDVGKYSQIAITSDGDIHVVYYDTTNGDLKYICHDGSAWQAAVTLDGLTTDTGSYLSMVADLGNFVHISYYDTTNANLRYGKGNCGAVWTLASVDTAGDVGKWSAIAIDK